MEPSNYVYQLPGDAWLRILQVIGFLGIFVLCIMLFCGAVAYWSFRMTARAITPRYQSGNDLVYLVEDIRSGFGLENYYVDEGILELEKLANKEL